MKTLSIKGKIKAFEVDYRVLFSDFKKEFNNLPVDTQIRCIQDLVTGMCQTNDLTNLQKSAAVESLKCLIRNIDIEK